MINIPINEQTKRYIDSYIANPGQAIGLFGPKWSFKGRLAESIAEQLLAIPQNSLNTYPYFLDPKDHNKNSIGIEEIRRINNFIALRVPSNNLINRVILIKDSQNMTIEAQNALLKSLEEPPIGTLFILTATTSSNLLPTITSRLYAITVHKPSKQLLVDYFGAKHETGEVNQAYLISGGLPALMELLLDDHENPYNEATTTARELLAATTFDRLNQLTVLSRDKTKLKRVFFILKQMAVISINSGNPDQAERWQRILDCCLQAEKQLTANVQTKLLLTNFIINLG